MNNVDRCVKCGANVAVASGLCMECLLPVCSNKKTDEKFKYPEMQLPHSMYGIGSSDLGSYFSKDVSKTSSNKPWRYDLSSTAAKYTLNPNVKSNSNVSSTAKHADVKYYLVDKINASPRYFSADMNRPASLSNAGYVSTSTGYKGTSIGYKGLIPAGKYAGLGVSLNNLGYGFNGKGLYGSNVKESYGSKGSYSGSSASGSKK